MLADLGVPIFWLEQSPEGLGLTVEEVAEKLEGLTPFLKDVNQIEKAELV
ncbi:hypothetical protein ACFQ38_01360 [Sporosarcina contaminans]|uniref:Uncharacterized protein n=1 Tax=Sporosarcina contaminans TaxID=633403 RepID=A0ABW3TVP6_9BACL